ncbi:MAG: hypothetical protein R2695_04065 [Acidimicrobiales bacterium]
MTTTATIPTQPPSTPIPVFRAGQHPETMPPLPQHLFATEQNWGTPDVKMQGNTRRRQLGQIHGVLERCPVSGKVSYPSTGAARTAAKIIRRQRGHRQRPYECEHCPHVHLTSSQRRRIEYLDDGQVVWKSIDGATPVRTDLRSTGRRHTWEGVV